MSLSEMPKDIILAARSVVNNWKRFDSFALNSEVRGKMEGRAIIYLSNRDSGCLDKSNESVILKQLKRIDPAQRCWDNFSAGHWAVGYVDGISIQTHTKRGKVTKVFTELHSLCMALAEYPILDDDDHTEREREEADRVWKDCYRDAERIQYIRDHRSQFEFHSFQDILGCVRGCYFAGYASELID